MRSRGIKSDERHTGPRFCNDRMKALMAGRYVGRVDVKHRLIVCGKRCSPPHGRVYRLGHY